MVGEFAWSPGAPFARLGNRQRAPGDPLREGVAFHELEHEVALPVVFEEFVNRPDIRMMEGGQYLGFSLESGNPLRVSRHLA